MENLTRAELFRLVADEKNRIIMDELFIDADIIIDVFNASANFIEPFEKVVIESRENVDTFMNMLEENVSGIENREFREYLRKEYYSKNKVYDKLWEFNDCFNHLVRVIATYHSKILGELYKFALKDKKYSIDPQKFRGEMPQTFLSYAYTDKGATLGLYLYFLKHGGFLYVDWMWSGSLSGVNIKSKIHEELRKSTQFLFFRSPNSELALKSGSRMIRQWCSWEIGNYYNLNENKKFYTNFYRPRKPSNDILDDFNQAHYVSSGIIY